MGAEAVRTAVYRFYDGDGELLYVGITKDPVSRFRDHERNNAETWWPLMRSWHVDWHDSRPQAAAAEVMAIEREAPRFNESSRPHPLLVSESGVPEASWVELGDDQWVNASEIARRVVALGIRPRFTRARVMQLANSPDWPVPHGQWRRQGNMWLFPWPPVEAFLRTRITRQGRRTDLGK
jgi:predicted GIY-YIG superfamily endonuclease